MAVRSSVLIGLIGAAGEPPLDLLFCLRDGALFFGLVLRDGAAISDAALSEVSLDVTSCLSAFADASTCRLRMAAAIKSERVGKCSMGVVFVFKDGCFIRPFIAKSIRGLANRRAPSARFVCPFV